MASTPPLIGNQAPHIILDIDSARSANDGAQNISSDPHGMFLETSLRDAVAGEGPRHNNVSPNPEPPPPSCMKRGCKAALTTLALGGAITGIVLNSMAAAELFTLASKLTGPVTWKTECLWLAAAGTTGVAAGITTVVGISLLQALAPSCSEAAGDGPRNTWGSWWGATVRNTALTVGCVSAIGSMAAQIALAGAGPWCTLAIPIAFLGYSAVHNTCCPTWSPSLSGIKSWLSGTQQAAPLHS